MSYQDTLQKHNFQFSKKFGQNFIYDQNLLQAIANDADISKNTYVLEIGTGAGSLTKVLAKNAKFVLSYEIDKSLQPILTETLKDQNNVELVFGDILKQNMQELENKIAMPYSVVANLPYYITTPILFQFLEQSTHLTKLVVMVQKEVAERLQAKPSTKDYGIISVLVQAVANVKITRIVNRKMFTPAPNVDSAIVKIEFANNYSISNPAFFKTVVKSAFAMRRKTLQNNLKSAFGLTPLQMQTLFQSCNLATNIRGEALSVQQFVNLAQQLEIVLKNTK